MSEQDKGGVYDVEELLARRVRMGRIEYKVHWRGYNKESDHTWESTENLKECWEMVQEFEKKRLNRKSKPTGRRITRSLTKRVRAATSSPVTSSPLQKRRSMGGAAGDQINSTTTTTAAAAANHHHRRSLNLTSSTRPNNRSKQQQPPVTSTSTSPAAAAGNSLVGASKKSKKARKYAKEQPPTCVIDLTLEEEDEESARPTTNAAAAAETSRTAAAASNDAAVRVLPAKTERKTPSNDCPASSSTDNVVKQLRSSSAAPPTAASSTPVLTCKQKQVASTTATASSSVVSDSAGEASVKVNGILPSISSSSSATITNHPPCAAASEKAAEKKAQVSNQQQQGELKHPLDETCSSRKKRQPTAHRVTNTDGSLVKICYKNQDCGNALDPQGIKDLIRKLEEVRKSSCAKVVLLHTIGEVFCSGLNVYEMRNRIKSNKDQRRIAKTFANAVKDLMDTLIKYPKILVAQVQGPAYGLGLVMLTLFDFVYASEEATFSAPYLKMGQIAEGCAAVSLPLAVGKYVANEIMLAGRLLRAEEAKKCGLVSRVYENDKFHENVITAIHDYLSIDLKLLLKQRSLMRGDNYERDLLEASSSNVPELIKSWLSSTFLDNIAVVDLNIYLLPESKRSQYRTPRSALNKLRRLPH